MRRILAAIVIVCSVLRAGARAADARAINVAAAISLKETITQAAKDFESAGGSHVAPSFDASGTLAAQIEQGAPIDLFISAALKQIDQLSAKQALASDPPAIVARTRLVLIVPADAKDSPGGFADLASPRFARIAIGEPKIVPAGDYAMQTLRSLKLDAAVRSRLVLGENVRQILTYVERGEVTAGIVYQTDALQAGDKVRVIATADESTHRPIVYPAAIVKGAKNFAGAKQFLDYLLSPAGQATFARHGFEPATASTTKPATQPAVETKSHD